MVPQINTLTIAEQLLIIAAMHNKAMVPDNILFLTGKLAEKRLARILNEMQPEEFTYEIRNIGVSVAALMTAQMLSRRLRELDNFDRIIVPGLCRGDLSSLSDEKGIPIERGPIDLKDLPAYLGHASILPDLGCHDVSIFAEIVDAPMLSIEQILDKAGKYRQNGADIIDIGCLPDTPFPHLEDAITALHEAGFIVSVDSLEDEDLLRGGRAGVDYLLSLKESTLWIADEVESVPVLIPDKHGDLPSLYRAIDIFLDKGTPFFADPILDPIHFGFTESIIRYRDLRQQYPETHIMMGVGNLTELTEADTTGINAILFGLISEMKLNAVLVTEVSKHCRTAVREADRARRIMFAARQDNSLPKGIDSGLLTTHARRPFPYLPEEIEEIFCEIRDPSYRVQISEEGIHIYNRDGIYLGRNPFELFPKLTQLQEDAPHAFYIGVELARAQIAWQLGKSYMQDDELEWGVCVASKSEEEKDRDSHAAHNMKELHYARANYKPTGSTMSSSGKRKGRKNDL